MLFLLFEDLERRMQKTLTKFILYVIRNNWSPTLAQELVWNDEEYSSIVKWKPSESLVLVKVE